MRLDGMMKLDEMISEWKGGILLVKVKVKLVIQVNHRSLLQVGDDCLDRD